MMVLDALFLCVLLIAFLITFCGFMHRTINNSCQKDRLTRRQEQARNRNSAESFSEIYVNSAYQPDVRNNDSAIFPSAPPPYSRNYVDPPPKYEDVIKTEDIDVPIAVTVTAPHNETVATPPEVPRVHSTAPPYTIST